MRSAYLHIPFCSVRCGYCDFNTYTASELGPGADQAVFAQTIAAEIDLVTSHLTASGQPLTPLETVFFGGGTPTLLPPSDLASILQRLRQRWGIAADAEVTAEANPDTITPATAAELAAA